MVIAVTAAGCAAPKEQAPFEAASFPGAEALPHVTVQGSLRHLLPDYHQPSRLEEFLYGPPDYEPRYLRNPQGMTLLGATLLVCDQGRPDVVAVDLVTGKVYPWGGAAHRPLCPVDVANDGAHVYVADPTMGKILVYDSAGGYVEQLAPPAGVSAPAAVLAHDGVLYVGDPEARCVHRWDITERAWRAPLTSAVENRTLAAPTGLAITPEGVLLIVDSIQCCVFQVSPEGEWLRPIGRRGRGLGEFVRPKHAAVTRDGLLLVSDAARQSIMVFDRRGGYLTEVHELADGWRGFTLPAGVIALSTRRLPLAPAGQAAASQLDTTGASGDDWVIVSDSLGGISLVAISVHTRREADERGAP